MALTLLKGGLTRDQNLFYENIIKFNRIETTVDNLLQGKRGLKQMACL